jgi:APA family basic amino acid/polyamine antiporter
MGNLLMYSFVSASGIALRMKGIADSEDKTRNQIWVWLFLVVSLIATLTTAKGCPLIIVIPFWAVTGVVLGKLCMLPQPNKPKEDEYAMPLVPLLPCLGIIGNYTLISGFDARTWIYYGFYLLAGLIVYFGYGITHSKLESNPFEGCSAVTSEGDDI